MKKSAKRHVTVSYNQPEVLLDLLIKQTAREFGLTEAEVKASAISYMKQNRSVYPTVQI